MNSISIKRFITKLLWIFPIDKNKYFFSSYEGKQYSCNPKCIYEELQKHTGKRTIVWELNSNQSILKEKGIITTKHNSVMYFWHLATARYIITNTGISGSISLRKRKQMVINTWHGGGAYKKVGAVISEEINGTGITALQHAAEQTTYFLSSSEEFTKIMIPSTLVPRERFLSTGMPRNDIFFNHEKCMQADKLVREAYGIDSKERILLFAPTYRGSSGTTNYDLEMPNFELVISALKEKFGGNWVVLFRAHYYQDNNDYIHKIINASDYRDMQELLCAADVLITDYSSSMWDYSLTYKPCFLFVPDLLQYERERGGFYSDISTWPGIVCEDNLELVNEIKCFSAEQYKQRIEKHHRQLGSFDHGDASVRVIDLIT